MNTKALDDGTHEQIRRAIKREPEISDAGILGKFLLDPAHKETVQEIRLDIASDRATSGENNTPQSGSGSVTPGVRAPETTVQDPDEHVREHYRKIKPVYDTLATIDTEAGPSYPTTWVSGYRGHYHIEWRDDEVFRRGRTIGADFEELLDDLDRDDRTMHVMTSWKDAPAIFEGDTAPEYDDFETGDGLGYYDSLRGVTIWRDIDLKDKNSRDELTEDEIAAIERDLANVAEAIADLLDIDAEDIAMFDSGGGAYPFAPAAVTLPIANAFEDDERARVLEELIDRINAYLEDVWDPESGLLGLDADVNNNRQSKAPLSIHMSKDVVVAPLRDAAGEIDFTPTAIEDVDETLISRTVAECEKIVDPTMQRAVGPLVSTLFDEHEGDWYERLRAWLDNEAAEALQRKIERDHIKGRIEKKKRDRQRGYDVPELDAVEDAEITDDIGYLFAAIDAIDIRDVVREFCCDEWDTADRSGETNFEPSWRNSSSGKSCFVAGRDVFGDNKVNGGGGPVVAYALGDGTISDARDHPTGRDWFDCVAGLRNAGYEIPLFVPAAGSQRNTGGRYDETPLWALRETAVALGICTPDDFVERETDDGGTYLGFGSAATYNATIKALNERDIDHGRALLGDGEASRSTRVELGLDEDDDLDEDERWAKDVLVDLLG